MDDPDEEALSKFLMENELDDPKWVSNFHKQKIVKPDQIYQHMDQEELYKSLSSGASFQEQAALRKILKITDFPGNPAGGEDINGKLLKFRLEPSYWSTVFVKQLGVTSTYSMEHVGSESYPTLKQFARKPWERKALRDLLKMEDTAEDSIFQSQREKQREKLQMRQDESKEMLQELKRLQKKGKNSNDEEVKYVESSICEALQISQELWLSENATLNDRIHQLEVYHGRIDCVLKTREISDVLVIQNASKSLALQGILLTKRLNDQLQVRGILLKVPKDIHLVEPSHFQHIKVKQFVNKQEEDMFTKTVDRLGYSVTASAKVGFWEFNLEAYSTNIQTTEEEQISSEHHERETYSSIVKYSIMPLASCYFSDSQLQFSDKAKKHLQEIEKLVDSNHTSLQGKCEEFFHKFGSHANKGPLHFGGKYQWKSYSHGFKLSDKATVQKLQSEIIDLQVSTSYGNSTADSMPMCASSVQSKLHRKYSQTLISQTFLEVAKTGGPPNVSGLPEWKNGLVASNSTWSLIDRGTTLVPVWDIIKLNHTNDFQKPLSLASVMSQAWKAMAQHCPEQSEHESDEDANRVMQAVKIWNESQDMSECKDCLMYLVQVKERLIRKSMNPQAWATLCLSQLPLQQYLKSVVDSCIQQRLPLIESPEDIKLHMRQLVEPLDLSAVKKFPNRGYICWWLYATDKSVETIVSMDYQDLLSLQKYFQYALDMYDGGVENKAKFMELAVQPDIAMKATAIVTKAVSCLRNHFYKAGQKYEDLFITTMLFPFKYDPDEYKFLTMFSACDLEYLCKEFEKQSQIFFRVMKQESQSKMQVYLFLLAIRMPDNLDVHESQIKTHLQYMKRKIGDDLSPQVECILFQLCSKFNPCNLQQSQSQLEFSFHGSQVQGEVGPSLEDVLATVRKVEVTPDEFKGDRAPSISNVPKGKNKVKGLFLMLGLTDFYPQKLTLQQALQIREDTLKDSWQCTDPKLFPFFILQKIMAFDYKSRAKLSSIKKQSSTLKEDEDSSDTEDEESSVSEAEDSDAYLTADDDESISDHMHTKKTAHETPTKNTDSDSDESLMSYSETKTIHPMDGLLALLHCSDNFLRQDLMSRLATCQLAIPLLLPDPFTHQLTFPLWAMRSIMKEWKSTLKSGKTMSHEGQVVSHRAPLVSFLRFGEHDESKSYMLNTIISDSKHDNFFHYNCDGGSTERLLVSGLVEICWYLQGSSDNVFPVVINFANLHGDARNSKLSKQVKFLSEISFINFVFLSERDMDDRAIQVLKELASSPGGLVLLRIQAKPAGETKTWHQQYKLLKKSVPKEKLNVIKLDKNEAEIKDEVRKSINEKITEKWSACTKNCTLEECSDVARRCEIMIDEDEKDCVEGKKLANDIKDIINKFISTHRNDSVKQLLPLQGKDFWHQWAMKDKEQYRHAHRGYQAIEEYGEQQRNEMKEIRGKQFQHVQNLSPIMNLFISSLLTNSRNVRNYFLQWLKLILDDLSREQLPLLHREYKEMRTKLLNIRLQKTIDVIAEKACKDEMDELNRKLIHASFGLEHLLREISQIYEAAVCESKTNQKLKTQIFHLPEMAAELLIDGYPLELMDGDAAHVPMKWVSAVLEKVQEKLCDPRLLILSILGLQSTGKSTLMNTIFGLRFSVSAGRCTRGAFMQLLPINPSLKQQCGCDYFLIVDTEGLRAPELDTLQTQKHDNELATFVIGVANLTVINIFGEIPGDLDDILQTAVHAFLRMKEVRLTPSCNFVHQNVAAVMAGEKGMMGRFKFKEKLDQMTQAAANEEKLGGQYKRFSQVIEFNDEQDVFHFPSLWKGDPPMAPVNPGYSMKSQVMKSHFIDFAKKRSQNITTRLSDFTSSMQALWKGVLHENFVFSFKNTLEIAAYNTLDAQYGHCSWSFQEQMMKWEQEAQNKLKSCSITELSGVHRKLIGELPHHTQKIHQGLKDKLKKFFEESSKREIIAKWKSETEIRLHNLHRQLKTHAENLCKQLATSRQALAKVGKMKDSHREKIVEHVKVLVSQLEKGRLNDTQLKRRFNEKWDEWISELEPVHMENVNVDFEVENSLTEIFNSQNMVSKLMVKPLREWGTELMLKVDPKVHIRTPWNFKRLARAVGLRSFEDIVRIAQQKTDEILKQVEEYLEEKQNMNFHPIFTNQILRNLVSTVEQFKSEDFAFTEDYKLDVALTACGYALRKFDNMVEVFKKNNDPVEYLEREMKESLLKVFKDQYKQVAQEKTAACTLCDLLSKSVMKQVIRSLSPKIVEDMRGKSPSFHSKPALKARILIDIGEKLNQHSFDECASYLQNVKRSLHGWIKQYTIQHCDEGTPSRFIDLANDELSALIIHIQQTTDEVTQQFSSKPEPSTGDETEPEQSNINNWLTEFHGKLQGTLELDVAELHHLVGIQQLKDVRNFNKEVNKGLKKLEGALLCEFMSMKTVEMDQWERKPYDIIFENLAGCTAQCPFCKEQCDLTNESHLPSTKHSVTMHRPKCLGGLRWTTSNEMTIGICTSDIGSDTKFRTAETNDTYHPYKQYQEIYPDWSIPDDKSVESSSYWKWLVGHYTSEIAELFKMKAVRISSEWTSLTWDNVKKDLEEAYHV